MDSCISNHLIDFIYTHTQQFFGAYHHFNITFMRTFIQTYKKYIIVFLLLISLVISGGLFVAFLITGNPATFFLGMLFTCIVGLIIIEKDFFRDI